MATQVTLQDITTIGAAHYAVNAGGMTSTLEIVSAPGMGKTTTAKALRDYLSEQYDAPFGLAVRHLSTEDPLDGPGVLHIADGEPGEVKRAERTYPGLFPQPWEYEDGAVPARGLLVLDEFGQADNDQKKAVATLIDERRLGKYHLPDGWMVLLTSNRVQDRAGVDKPLTFVTNRKTTVEVAYDAEQHVVWLAKQGVHPKLRGFVSQNASSVQAAEVPDHDDPYSTARSYYRACCLLQAMGTVIDDIGSDESMSHTARLARAMVIGTIGQSTALKLFGYLRHCEHMVSIDEIMKNPQTASVPERMDVQYAVIQMMADHAFKLHREKSTQSLEPMLTYMERLPRNLQMACIRMIVKVNKRIMMDAKYSQWVQANRQLLMDAINANN